MALNPVLKEAQQKGMISSSVNSDGEVGRSDAPTYTYANPVLREYFGETASARAENQQRIIAETKQRREEEKAAAEAAAKEIEKNRVKNTISGGLKNTFASLASGLATKYETGQGGRTSRNQESLSEYEYGLARAQKVMDDMMAANAEMPGSVSENEIRSQQNIIDDWQRKVDSMKTVLTDNVQQKATQASYETADLLQQSAQADIEKAKQGASKAGQFAVDVGAAATQMVGDVALGKMLGFNTGSPAMALRSFGGGAQKARHDGATLNQRVAYGAGGAALGVLTEKLGNIGLFKNIYGAGVFDKAISKLAAKPAGALAMSMLSEGSEEFLEAALEPLLQKITYNPSAAYDTEWLADALYSVAIGAALGGIGGVTAARHASKNKQGRATAETTATATTETAPEATIAPEQSVDTTEKNAQQNGSEGVLGDVMIREAQRLFGQDNPPAQGVESQGQAPNQVRDQQVGRPSTPLGVSATQEDGSSVASSVKSASVLSDDLVKRLESNERIPGNQLTLEQFNAIENRDDIWQDSAGKIYQMKPEQHIDQRKSYNMGDRKINAFQYDHPEIQPFYKEAAAEILEELGYVQKGGELIRRVNNGVGDDEYFRLKRGASKWISMLLDDYGLSYAQIEDACNRIIEDRGQENRAAAKRVEFVLDQMLTNGYNTPYGFVEANKRYVAAKESIPGVAETSNEPEDLPIWDIDEFADGGNATGAASAGFDPVQQLVDKYGAMPEGEGPITQERAVQVPPKTADDQYVSQSVRNAMEAQAIPNETAELIEPALVAGAFSDVRKTNAESVAAAEKTIRDQGWDAALDGYMAAVAQGKTSAEQTALGWTLMNNAANAGDGKTAVKILVSIAQNSRNTAQALQANRVLKQMSPAGQLYGIQQSINNLQQELNKTHGNNAPTLTISEELADQFLAAETQAERDAVMGEIMQNVADQVPSTWKDKWKAWRYMAMLANPRTHIRNILGNVGFQPIRVIKNEIAAALETALSAAGVDVARTKAFASSPALYKAAWNDFGNVGNLLGGNRYESETSQIKSMRTIFDNKALEGVRTKNSELLEAEDAVFKRVTYADALAGYLKANGVTAEQWAEMVKGNGKANTTANREIMPAGTEVKAADRQNFGKIQSYNPETGKYSVYFKNKNGGRATVELDASLLTPTKPISNKAAKPSDGMAFVDQARAYAAKEAMKATYQDDSAFARRVEKVAASLGPVGEAVMPFKRTPANILSRAMEYSPAGLAKSLTTDLIKVQQGKMTATDAIDNIAAGLTGSGLFALGAYLFTEGLITGAQGDDEDDEWNDLLGHQGYALELPNGKSITLDWLAPEAIPFFMGVETVSAMGEGGFTAEAMWDALKAAADPMLEQSMLQGVNDLIESVQYAEDAPLKAIIPSIITSYFSQAIPTVLGQIERSGEEERMTTYTEKDSPISTDLQYALGRASARLPGPEYNQIPYIDAWGRTEETGDTLTRIFNNTLNPAYVSQVEVDKVESELQRVRDVTGETSVFPDRAKKSFAVDGETKNLTKDEYVKYATKLGQTSYKTVSSLVNNAGYKNLSDEEKAEAISYAYQYANAVAKSSVSSYKADSGWVKGAMNSVLPADAYILYSINKDRNGNGSVDGTETALTLKEISGLTDKQRGQQWATAHSTTNPDKNPFTGALPKSGMSVDTAIKIYDKYRVLSNDDNLKSKQQAQMFGQYVYSLGLPKNQLDTVKNVYKVWGNYPIEW